MPSLAEIAFARPPNVSGAIIRGLEGRQVLNQLSDTERQRARRENVDRLFSGGIPSDPAQRQQVEQKAFALGGAETGLRVREAFQQMSEQERLQSAREGRTVATFVAGTRDQPSWERALAGLAARGIDVSTLPQQFDAGARDFYVNAARDLESILQRQEPVRLGAQDILIDPSTGRRIAQGAQVGVGVGGAGAFEGTSIDAQAMNILLDPAADPASGRYALAFEHVFRPRLQQVTRPDGTVMMAEIRPEVPPNIRHPVFGAAEPADEARVQPIEGTAEPRQFAEGQTRAAGFANRATASAALADELEDLGFQAGNLQRGHLPFIGNVLASDDFQRYERAKLDFVTAVLRRESGAAIRPEELDEESRKYFPQIGDRAAVINDKREARQRAINSLIAESQGAFDALFGTPAEETGDVMPAPENMPRPTTQEGYDALPDGAWYIDPNGVIGRKGR